MRAEFAHRSVEIDTWIVGLQGGGARVTDTRA